MTMSHRGSPETGKAYVVPQDHQQGHDPKRCDVDNATGAPSHSSQESLTPLQQQQQQPLQAVQKQSVSRTALSEGEKIIIEEINKCFINWYGPWQRCYLEGGSKFGVIQDLMEGLLHYEQQIQHCELGLPHERMIAIAKAVARLSDYGNAILDIDITIRVNDETFRELDPASMTTIELYKAHIEAQKLRNKLVENYFKRNKQAAAASSSSQVGGATEAESPTNGSPSFNSSSHSLRVPQSASSWSFPSPTLDRSQRFSVGSNSSINTLGPGASSPCEGRRSPQPPSRDSSSFIEVKTPISFSTEDLTESQLEMRHMIATIRSKAFSDTSKGATSTRLTLLLGVLAKVESLLTMPATAEKLTHCFELLDALLDVVERLPPEVRQQEVSLIAKSLLKTLVRKIYIDDRDYCLEFQHSHWTTYLLSIIRMMSPGEFSQHLKSFTGADLSAFLRDYLFIMKRLISAPAQEAAGQGDSLSQAVARPLLMSANHEQSCGPIYPSCWIEMRLLVCATSLKSLICLYQILRHHFNSNTQMWQSYLDCLVHFVMQEPLDKERRMLKGRQVLLATDLRKTAAEYVWIAWDSLGPSRKYDILEELIEPLLRACMVLDSRQRSILLPIFYNMMQCDYSSQYAGASSRGTTLCGSGSTTTTSLGNHRAPNFDENILAAPPAMLIYEEDFEAEAVNRMNERQEENDLNFLTSNGAGPDQLRGSTRRNSDESLPYLSLRDLGQHHNQSGTAGSSSSGFVALRSHTSNTCSSSEDGTVLTKFTHLIIERLNSLMLDQGLGDDQFKAELCAAISGDLNPKYHPQAQPFVSQAAQGLSPTTYASNHSDQQSAFKSMARHTGTLVSEFMQICLDLRQAIRLSYNHLHLLCLFKLILFFRDKVDLLGLYLANLHKLWCLHHTAGRFAEAGFTLLEHAKSLEWSSKRPLESHHRIITRSFQTPEPLADHLNLKLFLYTTIIEYFDQSQLWELALPLCREVADIYQFKLFDYVRLAQTLAKLSTFFGNIASGGTMTSEGQFVPRTQPEYFRVGFFGCGFPPSLRGTSMVYRGRPFEKLGDFQATLLSKYPDAELLKTLGQPEASLLGEPEAKYLQVNACSPVVDLGAKLEQSLCAHRCHSTATCADQCTAKRQHAAQASPQRLQVNELQDYIVSYYKRNECDKFEYSRRIPAPDLPAQPPPPPGRSRADAKCDCKPATQSSVKAAAADDFANMWRQRISLTTNSLPGMLHFFPVFLAETTTISPIECAIEDLERANDRLFSMVNKFKLDRGRQEEDVRPLGQLLLGIVDAAVNGGITKYEQAFFLEADNDSSCNCPARGGHARCDSKWSQQQQQQQQQHEQGRPSSRAWSNINNTNNAGERSTSAVGWNERQIEKLKCLIARQVPLLDEAIEFHRERVADVMRPQHEHLESSFKKLKSHVLSKYSRYLPAHYNRQAGGSTVRSFRAFARSPNRSTRSESARFSATSNSPGATSFRASPARFGSTKRASEGGNSGGGSSRGATTTPRRVSTAGAHEEESPSLSKIPYRQLGNERRSLPSLPGVRNLSLADGPRASGGGGNDSSDNEPDQQQAGSPSPSPMGQTGSGIKYEKILEPGDAKPPGRDETSLVPPPPPRFNHASDYSAASNSTYVCLADLTATARAPQEPRQQQQRRGVDNPYARLLPDPTNPDDSDDQITVLDV